MTRGLAPHYVSVRSPAAIWFVRLECAEAIVKGEADFLFVKRRVAQVASGSGRAPIVRFSLSGQPAVGKRAVHGGLLGPLLGGLYLGSRRALEQARLAVRLESAGVATPPILAVGAARVLGPMHTQAIVSRELQGGRNLLELAGEPLPSRRRRELLVLCADLLRRMHDAGFLHADLNVSNLVLARAAGGEILHIVDLDRGCFRATLSRRQRLANLARLLRSYEKWMVTRLRLSSREEILFLRRYSGRDRALFRFLAKSLARSRRRLGPRRICWRLSAPGSKGRFARPLQ